MMFTRQAAVVAVNHAFPVLRFRDKKSLFLSPSMLLAGSLCNYFSSIVGRTRSSIDGQQQPQPQKQQQQPQRVQHSFNEDNIYVVTHNTSPPHNSNFLTMGRGLSDFQYQNIQVVYDIVTRTTKWKQSTTETHVVPTYLTFLSMSDHKITVSGHYYAISKKNLVNMFDQPNWPSTVSPDLSVLQQDIQTAIMRVANNTTTGSKNKNDVEQIILQTLHQKSEQVILQKIMNQQRKEVILQTLNRNARRAKKGRTRKGKMGRRRKR